MRTCSKPFSCRCMFIVISGIILNSFHHGVARSEDEFLQVAMHDMCSLDDSRCGLPLECCCKPSHNFDFDISLTNETEYDEIPVEVLCVLAEKVPDRLPGGIVKLKILESDFEELTEESFHSARLPNLTTIYIWKNEKLKIIKNHAFIGLEALRTLLLENLPALTVIEPKAFVDMPNLRELKIKNTGLASVPHFTGLSSSLIPLKLVLDGTQISHLTSGAFHSLPLRIKIVQISWNTKLSSIGDFTFNGSSIAQLMLNDNKNLTVLSSRAFYGLRHLVKLSLRGTPILSLPTQDLQRLIEIDVRRTPNLHRFPAAQELPSLRIAELTYTYHCCSLTTYGFGKVFEQNINEKHKNLRPCNSSTQELFTFPPDTVPNNENGSRDYFEDDELYLDYDFKNYTYIHPHIDKGEVVGVYHENDDPEADDGRYSFLNRLYHKTSTEGSWDDDYDHSTSEISTEDVGRWREVNPSPESDITKFAPSIGLCYIDENGNEVRDVYRTPVRCTPEPDAFNPCENVLGSNVLPWISWIVSALAIFGNFFVILVLSVTTCDRACARHNQHHLSVQKFLVLNLAVADMCMGIYLLMISAMDARSSGEYYKYGVEWQTGIGCKISGFLSIFSSQLSVYTLCLISLERWYAIRFAIQLEKRMTMGCARVCMFFGWLLAGLLAVLPLVGVNNYEKTSICLPFDVSGISGMAYVGVLLFIAIGAFVVDVICYLWMYTTVRTVGMTDGRKRRGSVSSSKTGAYHGTTATADAVVAKRMAVLVFTNFACFFPISFFALTAAAGRPLISISQSKILLVIFYPINSCCNPFLYAILTKSFRRDLLAWFTSRGLCVQFVAKLNGAHWRRNSMDPASIDRRDVSVRKRLQRCVKYVSKKKSVNLDVVGDASGSFRESERGYGKRGAKAQLINYHNNNSKFSNGKISSGRHLHEFDNRSSSVSSCNSVPSARRGRKGISKFFDLSLVAKKFGSRKTRIEEESAENKSDRGIFSDIRWFKSRDHGDERVLSNDVTPNRRPTPDDSSPLVEMLDSRNESDFPVHLSDMKSTHYPTYQYGRRASKSRHSTTTIETRLTVNGNRRLSEDHEHHDPGSSIL